MTSPARRALVKLRRALIDLPAPWTVICNRGAGPPWVSYLALHPAKGIALVDLAPAQPAYAIAPLEEFLARTGLAAFADGDPPIIALAFDMRDLADVEQRLSDGFAGYAPCGIANANWPEALIELFMMTPDLALTRLQRPAERTVLAADALEPILATTETARAKGLGEGVGLLWRAIAPPLSKALTQVTALSRRAGAAAAPWLATFAAVVMRRSRVAVLRGSEVAARSLKAVHRATLAVCFAALHATNEWARRAARRTGVAAKRIGAVTAAGFAAGIVHLRRWGRAGWASVKARYPLLRAAALSMSASAFAGALHASRFIREIAATLWLRLPPRVSALWQRAAMTPAKAASFAVLALFAVALTSWAIRALPGPPPQNAASTSRQRLTAAAFLGEASPLLEAPAGLAIDAPSTPRTVIAAPSPIEFDIGSVTLHFDPPASYCVFPDPLLQTVIMQQGRINPGNVVHTVFGDCNELRAAAESQARIQDFGMLMTPKAQLDRPMSKAAFDRIVATTVDPRIIKKTLAQRLQQAESKLTLQSFSTLGVLQRDKDATYFAYLFKANAEDDGYTQACVMALTTVKGRLVAYYLYSDYTRDARATLMALLQKVRAGVGGLVAQNADRVVADEARAPG